MEANIRWFNNHKSGDLFWAEWQYIKNDFLATYPTKNFEEALEMVMEEGLAVAEDRNHHRRPPGNPQ